jgi:DNA-binding response OmpR family regulator
MARVLIVEDEPIIAILLRMVVSRMGHAVIGIEAREDGAVIAALRDRPELILIDQGLRHGTGTAAMQRILREGFIPHVFISGHEIDPALLGPGIGALRKPFSDAALEAAITGALAPNGAASA